MDPPVTRCLQDTLSLPSSTNAAQALAEPPQHEVHASQPATTTTL